MKIVRISFEDTLPYQRCAKKEHVSFGNPPEAEWYGIYDNGILVSFYCLVCKSKRARFKSNYTVEYYRKRGCLQEFIKHAKMLCKERDVYSMTCFCTEMSYHSHIRHGAQLISKKKTYYVKYILGSKR